jgi:hypothetical protein
MPAFHAILDPRGPNYAEWSRIFGNGTVPLASPELSYADLDDEKNIPVYRLNLRAMPLIQRARLLGFFANKLGVPIFEVQRVTEKYGFPIRAADVILREEKAAAL